MMSYDELLCQMFKSINWLISFQPEILESEYEERLRQVRGVAELHSDSEQDVDSDVEETTSNRDEEPLATPLPQTPKKDTPSKRKRRETPDKSDDESDKAQSPKKKAKAATSTAKKSKDENEDGSKGSKDSKGTKQSNASKGK